MLGLKLNHISKSGHKYVSNKVTVFDFVYHQFDLLQWFASLLSNISNTCQNTGFKIAFLATLFEPLVQPPYFKKNHRIYAAKLEALEKILSNLIYNSLQLIIFFLSSRLTLKKSIEYMPPN